MNVIRVCVVDDEPAARSRIIELLKEHAGADVVGTARNGQEALDTIRASEPDVVFLDIQMPDFDGFSVLAKLDPDDIPFVVFVTAYDEYALRAFDVHAVDYLLKPFSDDRFHEAMERIRAQLKLRRSSELRDKLGLLMREYQQDRSIHTTSFSMKQNGVMITIQVDDIRWIESAGNYVVLHASNDEYLHRLTMNAIASELDPDRFLRVHRGLLINLDQVAKVKYLNDHRFRFEFADGTRLSSGRSFREQISEVLAGRDVGGSA